MSFETLARKRASIRKYSDKKFPIETLMKIIDIGNSAPSPGNLGIIRYIVVEDKEKISKIADACMQKFIAEAPYLIIVCSRSKDVEVAYDKRAKKYVKQHTGAVIENMLLYITELGLSSCWIGAFSDMIIRDTLKIPEDIEIEAILPIAHQSKLDKAKPRKKPGLVERIFFETYGNKYLKPYYRKMEV